jgi:hypothetical protein
LVSKSASIIVIPVPTEDGPMPSRPVMVILSFSLLSFPQFD